MDVFSDLKDMKILANSGSLDYFTDRFGYPNLVFKPSSEFTTYLMNVRDSNTVSNPLDTPEVDKFLEQLDQVYDRHGYDIMNSISRDIDSNMFINIEPLDEIKDIIKNYKQTMDLSKIGRKRIGYYRDSMPLQNLIDNADVLFIDNNTKTKFLDAVDALFDILDFFKAHKGEDTNSIFYIPGISSIMNNNSWGDITIGELLDIRSYIKPNTGARYNDNRYKIEKQIEEYVLLKFKEIVDMYLHNYSRSLSKVHTIKRLEPQNIIIQLESVYNKSVLQTINDTIYKYI